MQHNLGIHLKFPTNDSDINIDMLLGRRNSEFIIMSVEFSYLIM